MNQNKVTEYTMEELECPKCGQKHSLRKYKTINVTEKEEMKEEIMKNRLFRFACDGCGYVAPLTYDSLYVDHEKNMMVYMAPVMNKENRREVEELEKETGMRKRLVDNINDLKEKIMIADNGLDDRIIEIIKIMYINQIKKEMEDDTLLNILFDYSKDSYCFLVFFQKKGIGKIPMTKEFYRGMEEKYRDAVEKHSEDKFMKVDLEWAGEVVFKKR
ncbi:MAG: CpXC domain-containing protein [Eubacterium sp.]|nr:CpXC domain-containing protein [Eubacterium sp.]MDD7208695.1 CpXC domain-containing protein [Lachnospiraceae bacterium]MDY5497138.1 CpXC domain-containing protein [Anaerobutyricum sp.]